MKRVIVVILAIYIFGCEKKTAVVQGPPALVTQANRYFSDSVVANSSPLTYRARQSKTVEWNDAQISTFEGKKAVVVPIVFNQPMMVKANFAGDFYFHLNYLTQLVMYQDSGSRFQVRMLTWFPDSNYFKNPVANFTGIQFVEDWQGNGLGKYLYAKDGSVRTYHPSTKIVDELEVVGVCYTISGYNYSADDPDNGYYWTEDAGCDYSFISVGGGGGGGGAPGGSPGGGGGGGGGSASTPVIPIPSPTSIVKSVKNYFQCFTNVGGSDHSYTITVCVDQPDPGTREPWTFTDGGVNGSSDAGNPFNVGHTFLMLSESYYGTTITRNIGFYPSALVSPVSPTAPGVFNDDENHSYNISGSFNVNSAQFFSVLNYITDANTSSYLYNLNTNNCTTFAINAAVQAGINLPRTVGTWLDGAGMDPGDLGEDIRSGSTPNMTVNTAPANNHSNAGQCN